MIVGSPIGTVPTKTRIVHLLLRMDDPDRERLYSVLETACENRCHGYLEHVIARVKHRAVHQYAVNLLTLDLPDQYHRDVVEAAAALHGFDVDIDQYLGDVIEPREIPLVQTVVHNCGSTDPVLVEGELVQDAVRLFDICIYGSWYRHASPYLVSMPDTDQHDAVRRYGMDRFFYEAAAAFAERKIEG